VKLERCYRYDQKFAAPNSLKIKWQDFSTARIRTLVVKRKWASLFAAPLGTSTSLQEDFGCCTKFSLHQLALDVVKHVSTAPNNEDKP